MTKTDIEIADRLSRRRARMLPILAILFLTQQASFFMTAVGDGTRNVDHVKISAWLVLSVVLLVALETGGNWFRRRSVRMLVNDEVTQANRASAMHFGFLAAMGAALVLYFVTMIEPVTGGEAIHLIVTAGIGVALIRFGILERRAHRDG